MFIEHLPGTKQPFRFWGYRKIKYYHCYSCVVTTKKERRYDWVIKSVLPRNKIQPCDSHQMATLDHSKEVTSKRRPKWQEVVI